MVNTKHGRFTSTFWRSLGVFLLSLPVAAHAVLINNGVPQGMVGRLEADVLTGGQSRTLNVTARRLASQDVFTENVLFDYFSFVDPGIDGGGFQLVGSDPVLTANTVTSNGAFPGANQNTILWTATSSIAGQVLTTRFTFATGDGSALGPLRFLQYLDEDLGAFGTIFETNVFQPRGSAGNGDLELFTFENTEVYGVSQSGAFLPGTGLQNASFAGWAADVFDNMQPQIRGGGQDVSPTTGINPLPGVQHPQLGPVFGPADIVSVLAWDVDPNAPSAVITTSLGGVATSDPTIVVPVRNELRCTGIRCTLQATCLGGTVCNNRIDVRVRNLLRTSEGTSVRQVRQRRARFASGVANVPAGQTAPVRLRLTRPARQFVRSTTRRTIRGVMEIRNVATGSSTTQMVRLRLPRR